MTINKLGRRGFLKGAGTAALAAGLPGVAQAAPDVKGAHLKTPSGKPLRGLFPIMATPFTADDKLDTDLLAAGQGTLCAKIGGEAVHLGGWRGSGLGWAVKIADGNKRALGPVLARAAELAGRPLPRLEAHMAPEVRNNRGEVVGTIEAVF